MKRRISAALLSLCLLMSLMPSVAFAAPNGSFDDVDGHWGQAAVERWVGYGVVNGDGSGNFNPDNQMTRAEFATMLANMLGYKEKAANTFADVNEDDWFADAILKLAAAGVMQGSNGMANPNAPITRQEAAVLMCRAFNIPTTGGNLDFADSADVADWAKGAVAALADRGMMNGVGNNNVAPLADINRASVATLLDNMITEYVTEDKTITGEVSGIVLVAADATVTVEDATLNENLIVAPKADGAEVTLTGTTTASDVVVGATATVKVESTASAGTVQVAAANSTVEVAGKADAVTVDSAANNTAVNVTESAAVGDVALNAADTKVSVAENATVSNVAVSGSNANVEVSGKVDNVTVSSEATGTGITANSGATVGKVDTSANDVTVSGSGKVENVTANDGTVSVTTPGTSVENKTDSKDNVTNNGKPVEPSTGGETPTPPSGGGSSGGGTTTAKADLVVAPLVDKADSNPITSGLGTVTVDSSKTGEDTYDVTVTGTNIMNHANDNKDPGHWVGFGMPAKEGGKYSYTVNNAVVNTIADRTYEVGGKTYNTVYFSFATPAEYVPQTIVVKDGDTTVATYNVTFKVTFYNPANDVTISKAIPANHADQNMSRYVLPAEQVAVNGLNVTLSGEVDPEQLNLGSYTYYFMKTSGNIAQLDNEDGEGFPASFADGQAVATKIYESNSLRKVTHTFTAKDAAGREQGTFTVTVDATGCTVKDKKTVKFNSNGGSACNSMVVDANATISAPTPTRDGYTFGGWYKDAALTEAQKWDNATQVTADITLYAKWTINTFTVTFQNGEQTRTETVEYQKTVPAPTAPTKEGYTFLGWFATDASTAFNFTTKITADTTLTAKWQDKAEISGMVDAVYAEYKAADGFKTNIPDAITSFQSGVNYTQNGTTVSVTGTLLPITTKWTGFNAALDKEQTGYYLLFQFEAPASAKQAEGNIVKTDKKSFTKDALDTVNNKEIFSFIWWIDEPKDAETTLSNKQLTFTVDWDGNGTGTGTEYTLDLSGLKLQATPSATPTT